MSGSSSLYDSGVNPWFATKAISTVEAMAEMTKKRKI
jgi:hypothetical protein